jgi:hypothetical protein
MRKPKDHITPAGYKWCSGCNKDVPVNVFHKDKNAKDGLSYTCKKCTRTYDQKYYKNNSDKIKEQCQKYGRNNIDKRKEYSRKYRQNNFEK